MFNTVFNNQMLVVRNRTLGGFYEAFEKELKK